MKTTVIKTQRKCEPMSGGDYTELTLSNGRIVLIWDMSVSDDEKMCIQVYDNIEQMQSGEAAVKEFLV